MIPYLLAAVGGYLIGQSRKEDVFADGGMMARGGIFEVGDMVKVDDNGYVKLFSGFDISQPAKIISKEKGKVFGKVRYFYGLETADGKKPFNKAQESMLTKSDFSTMADGGKILVGRFDEKQLRNGEDKKAIEKKMKETGLKYIDSRIIKKNGKTHIMEVYLYADGGMMAKGGKIPEKEIESLKKNVYKWYGKDGMTANEEDAEFVPPVTEEEIEVAVKEYVKYCNREGVDKWGGGDSFDREVIVDIMLYNRNPENESYFYPTLIKEIKSTTDLPPIYAKGGMAGHGKLYFVRFDTGDVSTSTTARGGTKEEAIENARKSLKLGDEKVIAVAEINKKNGVPLEMAKGGKVKKKWIQDALGGDEGSLRRTAKRKGLLKGDENLSMTDLKKLQKMGGKTGKRAHLAETLRKFDDGGMTDYYEDLRVYVQGVGTIYKGNSLSEATDVFDEYYANNPHAEMVMVDEKYGDEIKWANTSSTDDNDD